MSKPSLLLINPWIYDFALYDFWAKPLGLLYLASLLRSCDYNVSYIDCLDRHHPGMDGEPGLIKGTEGKYGTGKFYRQRMPKPSCLRDIPRHYYRYGLSHGLFLQALHYADRPDAVLVTSGMTYWYPGVFEVIRLVKQEWTGIPVILGGIYATLCPGHAMANSGADYVVQGTGEDKILPIIEKITGRKAAPSCDNHNKLAQSTNLDSLPYPAFDLMKHPGYVCLLTSRGCPFSCSYCAGHLLHPLFVKRSPENVAREVLFWSKKHGVKDFAFYDDALLVDSEHHIIPILEQIISAGIEVNFHTPNGLHAGFINQEIAGLMHWAGFKVIRLGLETTSDNRPDNKVTYPDFVRAVSCLKEAGFDGQQITAYLLMGLPGQSPLEVEEAIRAVQQCGAKAYLSEYSPIPGTMLWEKAVKSSRYNLAEEPLTHNNSAMACLHEGFTWEHVKGLKELSNRSC